MNGFQSTAINYNFFTGVLSGGRLSSGAMAVNTTEKDSAQLDAGQLTLVRLREALQGEGIALNPRAQPRSAGDVAGQVLNRVRAALEAAPDDAARIALLEKAVEGITKGIAEARDILGQAGVLQGRVAETVDAIVEQLQVGLEELAGSVVPATPGNGAGVPVQSGAAENAGNSGGNNLGAVTEPGAVAANSQVSVAAGQLLLRSASVTIETVDGDVVSLNFNRSEATAVAAQAQSGPDGASASLAAVRMVSTDLNYSVQGELDEEEVEALDELLGKISAVADKFFGGQLTAAFEKAAQLELDTEALSSYSIALESTRVQQVMGSYQTVASLGAPADTAASPAGGTASANPLPANTGPANAATPVPSVPLPGEITNPRIADAANAVVDVAQVVDLATQQQVIADPKSALPDIFAGVAQAKGFGGVSDSAQLSFSTAVDLLRGLIADLAPSKANEDVEHDESTQGSDRREDDTDE